MLKKLKIKFVIINMCLVGIVLLIVFTAVCTNTYRHGKEEVNRALEMALTDTMEELAAPPEIGIPPGGGNEPGIRDFGKTAETEMSVGREGFETKAMNYTAVVVLLDGVGSYEIMEPGRWNAAINDASMNEATLKEAVEIVSRAEEENGKLDELGLFYMKQETPEGTKAAFVDSQYFDATVQESILNALTLFLLGMAGLLLISILLARTAVAPVKKAWEQQKRFIADASHELKTPLTVILANNEILLSGMEDADESRKKWVESSQEEAAHMKNLVDDLLFLARSDEDAEGRQLVKSRLNLSELVMDVALQFEPVVFEVGLSIDTSIEEDLYMDCDMTQMKQLVHILLDNAVKYAGVGPDSGNEDGAAQGRIWIGLDRMGNRLRLAAANTGEVIDREDLEHLFERFYRSDQARTREGGYGLGLSIAGTIAENHGGRIRAQSGRLDLMEKPKAWRMDPGTEGTLFTVVL